MMKIQIFLVALMLMISLIVIGQAEDVIDINNIYPPSPDMKGFTKVEDLQIDYYSGKANIGIPLINVKSRQLTLDIIASYNMETLKVNQRAGMIGYNWNLNLPYRITRTIVGKPDELQLGYFEMAQNLPEDINDIYLNPDYFSYSQKENIIDGSHDYEPDVFNFNLPGNSGQFVFHVDTDGNRTIHTIPHQNIKIQTNQSLSYFLVTTTDGTEFHFGELYGQNNSEVTITMTHPGNTNSIGGTTAWFLNYIVSAGKGDTISFLYEDYSYESWEPSTHSYSKLRKYQIGCGDPIPQITISERERFYNTKKLKQIKLAESYVTIHYGERNDMIEGQRINELTLHLEGGALIKKVQFDYIYKGNCYIPEECRLFLQSIKTYDSINQMIHEPYHFTYFDKPIPSINSYGQDLWGYPNGKNGNAASLVPRVKMLGEWIGDADRSVDTTLITTGLLSKIQYPTGGFMEFEYEANSFGSIGNNTFKVPATINYTKYVERDFCDDNYPSYKPLDSLLLPHGQFVSLEHKFNICEGNSGGVQGEEEYKTFILDSTYFQLYDFYKDKDGSGGFQPDSVFLEKGKYYIMVGITVPGGSPPNMKDMKIKLTVKYKEYLIVDSVQQYVEDHPVGGARLKRIRTNDGITNDEKIRTFKYKDFENSQQSSGHISSMPRYFSPSISYVNVPIGNGMITYECHGLTLSSMPSGLHDYITGGHIVYPNVTELLGENGDNGYVQYTFSYANDMFFSTKPYEPPKSNADRRGDLLKKEVFDVNNSKVYEEETMYKYNDHPDAPNHKKVYGLKGAWLKCCASVDLLNEMILSTYDVTSRWKYKDSQTSTHFNKDISDPIVDKKYFYYDNPEHSFLTSTKSINSEGDTLITNFIYPPDLDISYAASPFASAVMTMNEQTFQIGKPLEATTLLHNSNGKYVIKSVLSEYKVFSYGGSNSRVMLNKQFVVENNHPIHFGNFNPIHDVNGIIQIDDAYGDEPEVHISHYDDFNNIEQYNTKDGITTSVIWGYNGKYPIAKAVNAERDQISYDPETGQQVSPPGSLMTTYKYHPIFGVIESADPNGLKTYYEYNGLGRLILIRDNDYNIIKRFEYNYASPQ